MSTTTQSHPKGLYVLFATEMWERFNYYGMRAILVLFLVKAMAFNQIDASQVYGSYTGLVYLTLCWEAISQTGIGAISALLLQVDWSWPLENLYCFFADIFTIMPHLQCRYFILVWVV